MPRVCIYGTLRKGRTNHSHLMDKENGSAIFICNAVTKYKYPLVLDSTQSIPYLLDAKGKGHNIQVEIYDVDEEMKIFLDDFEDVGLLYDISEIEVITDDGQEMTTLVYMLKNFKVELLEKQNYEEYSIELNQLATMDEDTFCKTLDDIVKEVKYV